MDPWLHSSMEIWVRDFDLLKMTFPRDPKLCSLKEKKNGGIHRPCLWKRDFYLFEIGQLKNFFHGRSCRLLTLDLFCPFPRRLHRYWPFCQPRRKRDREMEDFTNEISRPRFSIGSWMMPSSARAPLFVFLLKSMSYPLGLVCCVGCHIFKLF